MARQRDNSSKEETMADPRASHADEAAQQQMLQLDETKALASYANFCRVTGTPEEVIFDFGLNTQPGGQATAPGWPPPQAPRVRPAHLSGGVAHLPAGLRAWVTSSLGAAAGIAPAAHLHYYACLVNCQHNNAWASRPTQGHHAVAGWAGKRAGNEARWSGASTFRPSLPAIGTGS